MLKNLSNWLTGSVSRMVRRRRKGRGETRLQVESLEAREVMAQVAGALVSGEPSLIEEGERLVQNPASIVVRFDAEMSTTGGTSGANSVTNADNWSLTRNSVDVSSQISSIAYAFNATSGFYEATVNFTAALPPGSYVLTSRDAIQDSLGNALDGDASGAAGGDFVRSFSVSNVVPVGPVITVNTYTTGIQQTTDYIKAVATSATGDYVVVWTGEGTAGFNVYAQRFNAVGDKLGGEITVPTSATLGINQATVAMDATGNFVVSWTATAGVSSDVFAQLFDASGVKVGSEFQVNTITTGIQHQSSLAFDADGNFVVVWRSWNAGFTESDVKFRAYDSTGAAVTGELQVNNAFTGTVDVPNVTAGASGEWLVSFDRNSGGSRDVFVRRLSATGVALSGEILVNAYTTGLQRGSSIASDAAGNFVVVWESYFQDGDNAGVYGRRFDALGNALDATEFQVHTVTTGSQTLASVSMDADGDFAVTWTSQPLSGVVQTLVQRFSAGGSRLGGEVFVGPNSSGGASLAMTPTGDFLVVWNRATASGFDVYVQRFTDAPPTTVVDARIPGEPSAIEEGERLVQNPASIVVRFDGDVSTLGGTSGAGSVTNLANWSLTFNGSNANSQISSIAYAFNAATGFYEATVNFTAPLGQGDYVLSALDSIQGFDGKPLDGDATGGPGGNFVRSFRVDLIVPVGPEHRVNTTTTGQQMTWPESARTVATDAVGNYVVVWQGQNQAGGAGYDVYAQRYNAAGIAQGSEFRVNTTTADDQMQASVAMDADGDFVVVWFGNNQPGGYGADIYAQRYNAAGVAQGDEFRVNTTTESDQFHASVSLDADGDFVVVWTGYGQPGGYGADVYAQRYNAAGVAQGGEFRVNTTTASDQRHASVSLDSNGDFVVVWRGDEQPGGLSGDLYAQRYDAAGVAQGGEFRVNTTTAGDQYEASVSLDADGGFVVVWTGQNQLGGASFDVYAQRYNAAGVAQGGEFRVNTTTASSQRNASVSLDADGDFVVVWEGSNQPDGSVIDIYAQRYNAAGVAQGGEFRVNLVTANIQREASVAMAANGDFVVVWEGINQPGGSGTDIYAQRFTLDLPITDLDLSPATVLDASPFGTLVGTLTPTDGNVNEFFTYELLDNGSGAFSLDGNQLVVAGTIDVVATPTIDVTVRVTDRAGNQYEETFTITVTDLSGPPPSSAVELRSPGETSEIEEGERLVQNPTALVASFTAPLSTTGGTSGAGSVTNVANWSLTLNGSDVSSQIASVSYAFNATTGLYEATVTFTGALAQGDYVLTALDSILDANGQPIDGDGSEAAGGDFVRSFHVSTILPVGPEFLVNTTTTGNQFNFSNGAQAVATDDAGNFVVVWEAGDGSGYGIYAQRFNAAGQKLGGEFLVNTVTAGMQFASTAAMDADGDFIVVWQSDGQDGDGPGVFARRYNSSGVALDAEEFQVNQTTTGTQFLPDVAMDADGDFVVTWTSYYQDESGSGVYARVYNAAGVAQTGEIQVNTFTNSTQNRSRVAVDADGDFAVTWVSQGQDGSGFAIAARVFSAAGVAAGADFLVNTFITADQTEPTIAMDAAGNFVIAWSSFEQEGAGAETGIYAQRFNAAGIAQGSEFRVNTITVDGQRVANVAMDADGDFVVVWQSEGPEVGGTFGVYGQRYNSAGLAQGGQIHVNTFTANSQVAPFVEMDADGDFIAVWSSVNQDGSGYGVYGQRFSENLPPTDLALDNADVDEGSAQGTLVAVISATDPDLNEGFTYSFAPGGNAGGFFQIVGNELQIGANTPDFETSATQSVTIRVTDAAGNQYDETFVITINNVAPTTPSDANGATNEVSEGASAGTVVGVTASATDPAGGTVTYSLSDSAGGLFAIDSTTGVVTVNGTIDFETSGGSYTITVQASDGTLTSEEDFTITVNNVAPSAPVDANGASGGSVDAGAAVGTVVGITASSTDPAGGAVTYSLTSNPGSRFAIDSTTGVVTVAAGGSPIVAGDVSYTITVQASDGVLSNTSNFTITVVSTATDLIVNGTNGSDAIKVGFKNGVYIVRVNGVTDPQTYTNVSRIIVNGLGGGDFIEIDDLATIPAIVDGGAGNDTIIGGAGNDILLGGAGVDTISGYRGRDLIIGGLGKDTVKGAVSGTTAADAHILIGDSTDYDANQTALSEISAAWVADNATLVRSYLNSATVQGDGESDAIKSNSGLIDLIFSFQLKTNGSRLDALSVQSNDVIN